MSTGQRVVALVGVLLVLGALGYLLLPYVEPTGSSCGSAISEWGDTLTRRDTGREVDTRCAREAERRVQRSAVVVGVALIGGAVAWFLLADRSKPGETT